MGLIRGIVDIFKAVKGTVGAVGDGIGTLANTGVQTVTGIIHDQWREYFYCDAMPENVLVTKGKKRTTGGTSNTRGADNIITNGSVIAVNEGQCMMIVDQGAIVEFSAEPGEFTWNASTEPSIFYGGLGKGLLGSWETFKRRFTFGNETAKDQRVYYFNLKEILGNKYGTPSPVPFRVVDTNIGLDMDIAIRCNGEYSYKITDPMLFYKNVCGNITSDYTRDRFDSQLKAEFLTALQPAFAQISAMGVRYSALPGHTAEMAEAMNAALSAKWSELRGISVVSVGINSVTASPEDEAAIKELQRTAVLRNPNMAGAVLVGAQAEAMKSAAENKNGAMMGFMGMNMANQAGGLNANALFQMGQQQTPPQTPPTPTAAPENTWTCSCGQVNSGKFCTGCGSPRPEKGWTCPKCGSLNQGKFCHECGAKKPADQPLYRCDKCGWEPADPKNPPKFCPECGDRFDDDDIQK